MDSLAKTPRKLPKPVRFCDMIDIPGSGIKSTTPKPFKFQPVKTCELLKELEKSNKKKHAQKNLRFDKKESRASNRIMKPEIKVRKSTFSKPVLAKIVSSMKKKHSSDDTLPLKNLDTFDLSPYIFKKPLDSQSNAADQKLIPKKLTFHTNIKPPSRSVSKTVEKPGSSNKSTTPRKTPRVNKCQAESETNENIIELFNKKIDELYSKVDSRVSEMQLSVDSRLSEMQLSVDSRLSEIVDRLDKLELATKQLECKNCAMLITQSDSEAENLNNSCYIVENNPNFNHCVKVSNNSVSTPEINDLINKTLINMEENMKPKNLFTTNKIETVKKPLEVFESTCPNKILNKFELLESKLKYGSPMSDEFSLSDTDSPLITKDMDWLLNDKDEYKLHKSLSTPSVCVTTKKSVSFQSKSQNDIRDPVSIYNDMRSSVKFLCTPKHTKTVSNLMTPSVGNNQKKIVSRQIQKQILMLDYMY